MNIISSRLLRSSGLVTFGISTRQGGVSPEPLRMNLSFNVGDAKENVEQNRYLFAQALGFEVDRLAIPMQIHSNVVKRADIPGSYSSCDGLVTDVPDVYLCVSVADCIPIFLLDIDQKVAAAIHAGWRGTAARISERGVEMLVDEFRCRPERMVAFVGPGAGKCCYSVGEDVATKFSHEFVREERGKIYVDLKAANVSQLLDMGLSREMIEVSPYCTIDEANLLHSYRRDGARSGRMMGVIGLKTDPVR
jgi:polyphenol oxidase